MIAIKSAVFSLPEMSEVNISVNYVEIDSNASENQFEAHIHDECEIYINLSGDVSFEVEGRIYPVSSGSVIITRPLEYHRCIYHSDKLHRHFWITFSSGQDFFLNMFFSRDKGKYNLIQLDSQQLKACCRVLFGLLETQDLLFQRIGFLQLIDILRNGSGEDNISQTSKIPQDVMSALYYIEKHLAESFSIQELSEACNVSVNTLERHFKETLKVSPITMLRKKRLFHSMKLLRNGTTVTEAALESGFYDYSNYIQLFRKQFGLTPLQYKKKLKNK